MASVRAPVRNFKYSVVYMQFDTETLTRMCDKGNTQLINQRGRILLSLST